MKIVVNYIECIRKFAWRNLYDLGCLLVERLEPENPWGSRNCKIHQAAVPTACQNVSSRFYLADFAVPGNKKVCYVF